MFRIKLLINERWLNSKSNEIRNELAIWLSKHVWMLLPNWMKMSCKKVKIYFNEWLKMKSSWSTHSSRIRLSSCDHCNRRLS